MLLWCILGNDYQPCLTLSFFLTSHCHAVSLLQGKLLLAYLYLLCIYIAHRMYYCIVFPQSDRHKPPPPSSIPFSERCFDCWGGASVYSRPQVALLAHAANPGVRYLCLNPVVSRSVRYIPHRRRHVELSHATLIRSNTAVTWVSAWITMLQCEMVQSLKGLQWNLVCVSRGRRRADVTDRLRENVDYMVAHAHAILHMQSFSCIYAHVSAYLLFLVCLPLYLLSIYPLHFLPII